MQALQNVDDIEKKILQATTKTKESFEAMNGADTSANLALTVAKDAQKVRIIIRFKLLFLNENLEVHSNLS
jgi:hypothetical protein